MRRTGLVIFALGLVGGLITYACVYFMITASPREWMQHGQPELAWLKQEFNLSETEFARLSDLHNAYQPQCQEMCRRIDEQNEKLQQLLAGATTMTPEIESAIAESARLRGECQRNMMRHFFEVSETMPPEQGRRYLAWVRTKTFLPGMEMEHTQGRHH